MYGEVEVWHYHNIQHWLKEHGQCRTLATLPHSERACGTHCIGGCVSPGTALDAVARIPPPAAEPNSAVIQPTRTPLSILLVGQMQP